MKCCPCQSQTQSRTPTGHCCKWRSQKCHGGVSRLVFLLPVQFPAQSRAHTLPALQVCTGFSKGLNLVFVHAPLQSAINPFSRSETQWSSLFPAQGETWHPRAFAVLPKLMYPRAFLCSLELASPCSPARVETSLQALLFCRPWQHTSCSAGV